MVCSYREHNPGSSPWNSQRLSNLWHSFLKGFPDMEEGSGWGGKLLRQDRGSRGIPSEGGFTMAVSWLWRQSRVWAALDPNEGSSREGSHSRDGSYSRDGSHSSSDFLDWLPHLPTQTLQLGPAALSPCWLLGFWDLQSHGPHGTKIGFSSDSHITAPGIFYKAHPGLLKLPSQALLVHLETHFRMESCVREAAQGYFFIKTSMTSSYFHSFIIGFRAGKTKSRQVSGWS